MAHPINGGLPRPKPRPRAFAPVGRVLLVRRADGSEVLLTDGKKLELADGDMVVLGPASSE